MPTILPPGVFQILPPSTALLLFFPIALLLLVAYKIYDLIAVPASLRNIPTVPFWANLYSFMNREPFDQREKGMVVPRLGEKEGIVLKFLRGRWIVTIANPEHAKTLLLRTDIFPKSSEIMSDYMLLNKFIGSRNMLFQNGDTWKRHRLIANPAFHRAMPAKLFGTLTLRMFEEFEKNGNFVEVYDMLQRFALDAIGMAAFDFDFNAIPDAHSLWHTTFHSIAHGISDPLFFLFPFFDHPWLVWMFPARQLEHHKVNEMAALLERVIAKKKAEMEEGGNVDNEHGERDLLSMLIEANEIEKRGEEGKGLSDRELRDNLAIFLIAGHETTANALTTAIYYLAANKDCQQKARKEALAVLGDGLEDILPTLEQTKELKYINMVMKETMRLNPPAGGLFARRTTTLTTVGHFTIPPGTYAMVDIFAMHHSPLVWNDPERFDPERFAEGGEHDIRKAGSGYPWLPFSNGARQCIGMNFSLVEQRVVLAMLLRRYEWSLPVDSIHRDSLKLSAFDISQMSPADLWVQFERRY